MCFGLPLGGLVGTSTADAKSKGPKVFLAPVDAEAGSGASLLSDKFDGETRSDLRQNRTVTMVGDGGGGVSVSAGDADPRVQEAENLRTAGKDKFAAGDYEGAVENLRAALDLYEEALASVERVDVLAETLGYLGAASVELGYGGDAKDYFRRVTAMMPDAEPLDEYSAKANKRFAKEKKRAQKKIGRLEVKTDPPGATIFLDGREVGTSPVKLSKLSRGDHYVQARHPEAGIAAEKVRVKGRKAAKVSLVLQTEVGSAAAATADAALVTQLTTLAAAGDTGDEFRGVATQIAEQTSAEYIVVGRIGGKGSGLEVRSELFGVRENHVARLDSLDMRPDLSSMSVAAVRYAGVIEAAVNDFPFDAVIVPGVVPVPPKDHPEPEREPVAEVPPREEPEPRRDDELPTMVGLQDEPEEPKDDDDEWYTAWW
ncbi:MAG: PEGA domain-containing protein, partial [Planctomycetota bacterium]